MHDKLTILICQQVRICYAPRDPVKLLQEWFFEQLAETSISKLAVEQKGGRTGALTASGTLWMYISNNICCSNLKLNKGQKDAV